MRELIVFFIFLSFFGCKKKSSITSQVSIDSIFVAEKFNPSKIYSDSISLYYKGKSILQIGQSTEKLEKSLSFRPDPNLKHQNYWPYIIDYLSTDDFYTIKQTEGSINGIIFFSTNVEKKIFAVNGSWTLDIPNTENAKKEALQTITTKIFPCLANKLDFVEQIKTEIEHTDFKELFELSPPKFPNNFWVLKYEVKLKNSL